MDDDAVHGFAIGGAILIAVIAGIYIVSNLVSCREQWTWYGRDYEPAYTWTSMECTLYDSKGVCRISMPVTHHEPEKFVWLFRDCRAGEHREYVGALQHVSHPDGNVQMFTVARWKRCPCISPAGGW